MTISQLAEKLPFQDIFDPQAEAFDGHEPAPSAGSDPASDNLFPIPGSPTRSLENISVADYFIAQLETEGTDAVFGIPGGNIAAFQQSLRRHPSIRYVIASHEGGAAFMADGYARATGKLGVCLVTAGPGVMNALTGIASAHLDQVPVLAVSGQIHTSRFGLGSIQESTGINGVDTVGLLRHATKLSAHITEPQTLPRIMFHALNAAFGFPGGAVHMSIPSDVARQPIEKATLPATRNSYRAQVPAAPMREIAVAFEVLRRAKRPLIFLGSGARNALEAMGEEFAAFVHRHRIPVASSVRGKGLFSERDPLSLGVMGMAASRKATAYLKDGVDVMLVLGSRLGEWSSRSFHQDFEAVKTVIQVDIDPTAIGRFLPVALPIVGDVKSVISGLCRLGMQAQAYRSDSREKWLLTHGLQPLSVLANDTSDGGTLKPQEVMAELERHLKPSMDIYVDMGNCTAWAAHCLHIVPPTRIFYPSGLSSMGWSCGAVVGGKIGRPDRTALSLTGDGAFLMNGNELLTAARYKVGTVTLVLNDNYLGTVNHGEHAQEPQYSLDDEYYSLGGPDLIRFSESLGARTYIARRPGDIDLALTHAIKRADLDGQPQVIVARIDHRVPPPYGERFTAVAADAH